MPLSVSLEPVKALRQNISRVFVGKEDAVELILTALVCGGHVLIEDVPGLGKTTLVSSLARSLGCSFARIQFTPDLMPADVTGYTLFNMATGEKEVHMGSIMHQIVLADEINRTGPKTQSSLLEAMQEGQVSIDGVTYPLPTPFMVLATQNPAELTGTFPLPEAQLDRFLMRISLGYPTRAEEKEILERNIQRIVPSSLPCVMSAQELTALQEAFHQVGCAQSILDYIISVAEATRRHEQIALGVSPRGSLALMNAARGYALLQDRDFVQPDDVQKLVEPVLVHRILLHSQALFRQQTPVLALRSILREIPVPHVL